MNGYFLSIWRFFILIGAVAALLLSSGCGGGGGQTTTVADAGGRISVETGSLSKTDFVKQVNELCSETKSQFEQRATALAKLATANGQKELQFNHHNVGALVAGAIAPSYEGMIRKIRVLGAPSGDEEGVAAFLNAIQKDLNEAKKHPVAAFRANEGSPFVESAKQATAYGLSGCVETLS
jgi:hypothetical protein